MDASRAHRRRPILARIPWGTIFGLAFVIIYVSLTIIAASRFPGTVSPLDIFLSTLGNANLSPDGAIFYNLAIVLGGAAEFLFFIAIYAHYSQQGRQRSLIIGLIFGLINGFAVIMSGIHPEYPDFDTHETWSYLIFFSMIPLLLAFSLAFLRMRGTAWWTPLFGFLACVIDVIFLVIMFSDGPGSLGEWIAVLGYLIWALLVSLDVFKRSRAESLV